MYVLHVDAEGKAEGEPELVSPAGCRRAVSGVEWSPDGVFIAWMSADEKGAEGERKERERDDANVYGEGLEFGRVRVLRVGTGEVDVVYAPEKHVTSFAWSADSKRVVCAVQADLEYDTPYVEGVELEIVTLEGKGVESVYHHSSWIHSPLAWGADGVYFVAGVEKHTTSIGALWKVDVAKGTAEITAYGESDSAAKVKATGGFVCTMVASGLSEELRILGGATIYSAKEETVDWDVVANGDGDGYIVAVTRSSVAKPTEVYSFNTASASSSSEAVQLSSHGAHIAAAILGVSHELSCRSYDGKVLLEGFYVTPTAEAPEKPLPTVVLIHGGPNWRQTDSFYAPHFPWMPMLLAGGKYGVLLTNYRGNTSQGEAYAAHVLGNGGTLEYDDILASVDEGIKRGFVDPKNVIVGGWSYGGLLTYMSCVRNGFTYAGERKSWKYKGAIAGAGISDWDMMASTSDAVLFANDMNGGTPWNMADKTETDGRRGSAILELKKGRDNVPAVLILHGEQDVRCPVSQAWAFQRGCKKWKIPCEMVTYPRGGHMIEEKAHLVDMLNRVKKFCDTQFDA